MKLDSSTKSEVTRGIEEGFKHSYDCFELYARKEIEYTFRNHVVFIDGSIEDGFFQFLDILIINELKDEKITLDYTEEEESEFVNEIQEILNVCVQELQAEDEASKRYDDNGIEL